jgi:hypothetical protein
MEKEGPVLETLTRHLIEIQLDFLKEPKFLKNKKDFSGAIDSAAVIFDLLALHNVQITHESLVKNFQVTDKETNINKARLRLILSWLLFHSWFQEKSKAEPLFQEKILPLLQSGLDKFAPIVPAINFIQIRERREELVRYVLEFFGYRPQGENAQQAKNKLAALDSVEEYRVIQESRKNQEKIEREREVERQRKIREEMEREREASKVTRD